MSDSLREEVDSGFDSSEGATVVLPEIGEGEGGISGSGALSGGGCSQPDANTVITVNNPQDNHRWIMTSSD
ncbi:MAG: hypothetical protein FJ302_14475 [Planctomycetes bacterium]|nr:hypothetical protein [Planctomycetota bacterium]